MNSNYVCAGVWGAWLLAACNASVVDPIGGGPEIAGQSSENAAAGNGNAGQSAGGQSPGDAGSGGARPRPTDCAAISAEFSAQVANQETCSLVVRVDSLSLWIMGHTLICGPRKVVDEASARAADAATSLFHLGFTLDSGELLSDQSDDVWVFRQILDDGTGHVSAVSAISGETLFWGFYFLSEDPNGNTLAGTRVGIPLTPKAYGEAAWATTEIGTGCYEAQQLFRGWGLDLRVEPVSEPLLASIEQVLDRVLGSALVAGLVTKLSLTSVADIHYGLMTDPNVPPRSEHIVIVTGTQAD